jgi:hypothetical protein
MFSMNRYFSRIMLFVLLPTIISIVSLSCSSGLQIRQSLYDYINTTAQGTLAEMEKIYSQYEKIAGQKDQYENQVAALKSSITDLSGCYTFNTQTGDLQKCTIRLTIVSQSSMSSHWLLRMQRGAFLTEADISRMKSALNELPQAEWNIKYAQLCKQRLPKLAAQVGDVNKIMALLKNINYRDWQIKKTAENVTSIIGYGLGSHSGGLSHGEWHSTAVSPAVFKPANAQAEVLLTTLTQKIESVDEVKKYIPALAGKVVLPKAANDTVYSDREWQIDSGEVKALWEIHPRLKTYMLAISDLGYKVSCRGTVSKLGWGINRDTTDEELVLQVLLN